MQDEKQMIDRLLKTNHSDEMITEYRKLVSFIDAGIAQAFRLSGDERAQFLMTNLLNMRDFLSSEIVVENTIAGVRQKVQQIFHPEETAISKKKEDHVTDLESLSDSAP